MPSRALTLKNGSFTSTVRVNDWDGEAGTINRGVVQRATIRIGGKIESAELEGVGNVELDELAGSAEGLYRVGRTGW